VAQLNSALDYGSRGYWFESSRGHEKTHKEYKKLVKSMILQAFVVFRQS
tara:strand:+ start:2505 stop:2651 length:147 start_codon:yes stop_codon:yes gene_type:complete